MVKRALASSYSENSIAQFGAALADIAHECATGLAEDCELVDHFLRPFWLRGTAHMLGVPHGQSERLGMVVSALSKVLALPRLNSRSAQVVDKCIVYLRALIEHLFEMEVRTPIVNALREIAQDRPAGGIWLGVSTLSQLLTAGFQPSITGAALGWRALHAQGDLGAEVRAGSFDLADFVDEVLRLDPPFPFLHRWVISRCDCHGVVLEPGTHLIIDVRRVNRDPAVFDRPDDFVPGRNRGLGISFGHGPHRCVGPAMARLHIRTALQALLSLDPPLRPVAADADQTRLSGHLVEVRSLPCRRDASTARRYDDTATGTTPSSSGRHSR